MIPLTIPTVTAITSSSLLTPQAYCEAELSRRRVMWLVCRLHQIGRGNHRHIAAYLDSIDVYKAYERIVDREHQE